MANTIKYFGLRPVNQPYGAVRCTWYQAATGTAMYRFQPVDLDTNGRVVVATQGSGNFIVGSAIAFADSDFGPISTAPSGYLPAYPTVYCSSAGVVNILVADDPNQLFEIVEDTAGTTTALTAQDMHLGVNLTCGYSSAGGGTLGNTNTGVAEYYLDRTTIVTGSNQQLRIIKKLDKPDNALGDWCVWIVKPYYHRYNPPNQETSLGTTV